MKPFPAIIAMQPLDKITQSSEIFLELISSAKYSSQCKRF